MCILRSERVLWDFMVFEKTLLSRFDMVGFEISFIFCMYIISQLQKRDALLVIIRGAIQP